MLPDLERKLPLAGEEPRVGLATDLTRRHREHRRQVTESEVERRHRIDELIPHLRTPQLVEDPPARRLGHSRLGRPQVSQTRQRPRVVPTPTKSSARKGLLAIGRMTTERKKLDTPEPGKGRPVLKVREVFQKILRSLVLERRPRVGRDHVAVHPQKERHRIQEAVDVPIRHYEIAEKLEW